MYAKLRTSPNSPPYTRLIQIDNLQLRSHRHVNPHAHYSLTTQDQIMPRPTTALAPCMPPNLSHTEDSQHWLRHISVTTADNTEVGTTRLYRAPGPFPNTVDSSYHSRPTRHGGLHRPAWQPYIQHFSTKYYLRSEVRNSLHT
jgi:hypothetical protein